jgi:hypothetical protein
MTRYYSVVQSRHTLVHLTLTPAGDGVWPHTLCGAKTDVNGDVDEIPNCIACIAGAVRYDQALDDAYEAGRGLQNPCTEVWLNSPWGSR